MLFEVSSQSSYKFRKADSSLKKFLEIKLKLTFLDKWICFLIFSFELVDNWQLTKISLIIKLNDKPPLFLLL